MTSNEKRETTLETLKRVRADMEDRGDVYALARFDMMLGILIGTFTADGLLPSPGSLLIVPHSDRLH